MSVRILVFDVSAETGGALTILREWHKEAVQAADRDVNWFFIVSLPELQEAANVKVLRFPWVKRSWLHRLYFDCFLAPRLVKKYEADEILSLQNLIVPRARVPQTVYVHQSLPFTDKRFKVTEAPRLWFYQNIIGKMILWSMRRARKIIVQTRWMKDACVKKSGIDSEKIVVMQPAIRDEVGGYFEPTEASFRTFFYPASGVLYKNHKIVVDAAILLKERGISNYKVLFTLKGDENNHINRLRHKVKDLALPIQFIGPITSEQVSDYYTHSVLVFPSYIETFGLPLLEARLHRCPILASDCPFSHEILNGYEKAFFFGADDAAMLADLMERSISMKLLL